MSSKVTSQKIVAKIFILSITSFITAVMFMPKFAVGQGSNTVGETDAYSRSQKQALQGLQSEFDRITSTKKEDSAIKAFCNRLTALDEVAKAANAALAGNRGHALDDILRAAPTPGRALQKPTILLAPSDLLGRFSRQFAQPLPQVDLSEADRDLLHKYYLTKLKAITDQLSMQAGTIAAVDPSNKDTVSGLALVPLWLSVRDEDWTYNSLEILPGRLRSAEAAASCERAALAAQRPVTAFIFSTQSDHRAETGLDVNELLAYVRKAGTILVRNKHYEEALACLEAGIRTAEKKDSSITDDLRIECAQLLSDINRPADAAATLKNMVDPQNHRKEFGRACVLRLKYLYQANDFTNVLSEYRSYADQPEAKEFQPQILYVAWCTARQTQPDLESRLRKEFLDKFPTNTLGADLYFSTAMESLASSDFAEARRILEYIEYRYPNSPLLSKVHDIQKKLAANKDTSGNIPR